MRLKTDFLLWLFLPMFLFSCASTKPPSSFKEGDGSEKPREAIAIVTPRVSKKTFSTIDESLLQKIENASLKDLQEAILSLKRNEARLSNDEKILLRIAYALQAIVYQEKIDESLYLDPSGLDSYAATIAAAKKGVYDFNSSQEDFFALTLPSLVLLTAPAVHNYYEEAYLALEQALVFHPGSFLAEYFFALLLERALSLDEALPHYKNAYNKNPSFIVGTVRYMNALFQKGETDAAFEKALEVLSKEDQNLEALLVAAHASFLKKNYDNAEIYISRLLQREPNNNEFILFRAKILMAKEEYMKASSLLDMYAKTDKTAREYLLLKALLQRDWNKNPTAAANTLQEALSLYPDDLDLLLIAASISAQIGQKVADLDLEDLLFLIFLLDPENSEAIAIRVGEEILQENWEEAYKANKMLFDKTQKDEIVLFNHIKICVALAYISEARQAYQSLLAILGETEELALCNIRILIAEKQNSNAKNQIEKILAETTNTKTKSALYFERSKLSLSSDQKLNDLRLSLTANPRNADALFSLYRYYFDEKEYRKAQYYLKQAVSLNTNSKILLEKNKELDILLAE